MMDNLNIPACAMYRQIGTVIVKTEDMDCCSSRHLDDSRTDFVRIPAKCEKCQWTRTDSKYSECDSGVEKSRPYRSSAARRRYVNVCAAVCLLLLVGGLSPQSSAAPHRRAKMERQRRAAQENPMWGNPCDYADGSSKSTKDFSLEDVKKVKNQATNAFTSAEKYKDKITRVLLDDSGDFEKFRAQYEGTPWLHSDQFQWFMLQEVLPKDKTKLNQTVSPEFLNGVVSNIDSYLPSMQMALKMLVACLNESKKSFNEGYAPEVALQNYFDSIKNYVKQVLCYFNEVMDTRKVEAIPLLESEVPSITTDRVGTVFRIYRDTLLYLDYLSQVMDVWVNRG